MYVANVLLRMNNLLRLIFIKYLQLGSTVEAFYNLRRRKYAINITYKNQEEVGDDLSVCMLHKAPQII